MENFFFIIMKKKNLCRKIEFWATAQVYCKARRLGVQALGARGARRRACVGARASWRTAGARDARGARQERQAHARQADAGQGRGRGAAAVRRARGARRQRAAGARATGGRRAGRHGVGAQGRAAGRTVRRARPAWAWPGRWMGVQAGPVLVHCAPGSVLARFLDPVRLGIFLSHQMNTVHCKINF